MVKSPRVFFSFSLSASVFNSSLEFYEIQDQKLNAQKQVSNMKNCLKKGMNWPSNINSKVGILRDHHSVVGHHSHINRC